MGLEVKQITVILMGLFMPLMIIQSPVVAQDIEPAQERDEHSGTLLFLLDNSGSMACDDGEFVCNKTGRNPKIDSAVEAVIDYTKSKLYEKDGGRIPPLH